MQDTNIEWAHHTFNPWIGCTKVGPGCDNCYAEADFDKRRHIVNWGSGQPRKRTAQSTWAQPLRWNAKAKEDGVRYRVFCASLADVFDNEVPEHWRWDLFRLIAATPHLDWLLLTKRIGNARAMLNSAAATVAGEFVDATEWDRSPWPNVWVGATITSQSEADRDIPKLLDVPASKRFLSMEPLLGAVDLTMIDDGTAHRDVPREEWGCADDDDSPPGLWWNALTGERTIMHGGATGDWSRRDSSIDWVIVGGESGPNARPMHPDWVRSLRDQCQAARTPFLFKQWGDWIDDFNIDSASLPAPQISDPNEYFNECEWGNGLSSWRVGKKAAGRLLDGCEWNGYPCPVEFHTESASHENTTSTP